MIQDIIISIYIHMIAVLLTSLEINITNIVVKYYNSDFCNRKAS